ncbi:MarR family transcriptional regulator [Glycomyces salinus]|uniref:MarR family transcriptional regulator n=1 Tax=Glycomyces salinus TaxID=980294 RepID=UPI0018EAC29B|nr:helix-turn-helix domain-containing protein [Glycomyces salinus]
MEPTTETTTTSGDRGEAAARPRRTAPAPPVPPTPGMGRLLSRQAAPHYAAGCLIAAAAVANAAGELSGEAATAAAVTVGVLFTIAVLLACKKSIRLRVSAIAAECGRTWLAGLALGAAGWVAVTGIIGVSVDTVAALLAMAYGMAGRWWRAVRIPNPRLAPDPVEPPATSTGLESIDAVRGRWNDSIGCKGGPLAGAQLADREVIRAGLRYTVQLVPGKQTTDSVFACLPRIASGLRCDSTAVFVDPVPGDASRVTLSVLTHSPINRPNVLETLEKCEDGTIRLGPWGDGDGLVPWRLYTANSMWGGVVVGGPGSGKSALLAQMIISVMWRGDTVVWAIDGQDGASLMDVWDRVDWAGGKDRAETMLKAAHWIVEIRSRQNTARKWKGFDPAVQGRPGLFIVIDESHMIFEGDNNKQNKFYGEDIARRGRKAGVEILTASQYAAIRTFGGSKVFRSSVMDGNAIALRTSNKGEKGFFPSGFQGDPSKIPAGMPGTGYAIDVTGAGKTAPFRSYCTADFLPGVENGAEYSQDWWLERCPEVALDDIAANTADFYTDGAYSQRHQAVSDDMGRYDEMLDALSRGLDPSAFMPGADLIGTKMPTWGARRPAAESSGSSAVEVDLPATLVVPKLIALSGGHTEAATGPEPKPLSESAQRLLTELRGGPLRPKDLIDALGLSRARVNELLKQLQQDGHVYQPEYGRYALAEADAPQAA